MSRDDRGMTPPHEEGRADGVTEPLLYSFRRCPYAMRARLALMVSGMRVELREVRLSQKPDAMLAASAKGTVPVMVMPSGEVIDESLEIMRRALGKSDPERWLDSDDAALIAANDGPFKHDLDCYKYPERHGADAIVHRGRGLQFLRELEGRLAVREGLHGTALGLTDAAVVPFVRQFAAVDRAWFDAQPLPCLRTWLDGYLASPLFEAAMVRVTPWSPGDAPVFFHAEPVARG